MNQQVAAHPPDERTTGRWQQWLPPLVFAVAAFLAILPLLLHGCSCGHDFDFHLLSWMEAASQWQHGILKPVWAFTPAFNAGEPRLLMYPPLSWATGAALGLLLPWTVVPPAFTWLVLFLCGVSMHRLLRRWTSPAVAMLGGCLYMVNPYMLFVAYERTAYAELMAAAWMPLLLAAMLRSRITAPRVAFVVALLWLTNAPAAVVGCYSILLLGVARLLRTRGGWPGRLRMAGTVAVGVGVGLLLDAFYLIPMGWERRFVQLALAIVPIARPDANFLFTVDKDVFHTHVLVQASWIAIAVCATAALCGVAMLVTRRGQVTSFHSMHTRDMPRQGTFSERDVAIALLGFTLVLFFLLCRWSAPVWHVVPELVFLQFPWRFLAIESAVAITLVALAIQRYARRLRVRVLVPAALLTSLLAGYFAGGRYFREECADDETVQAQRAQYVEEDGVGPTDEYTPQIADNDELPVHLPPAWLAANADGEPGKQTPLPETNRSQPEDVHFAATTADKPQVMIVRLRKFPGWHALRDGEEIQPGTRVDGLIVVPLSAGHPHHVEVVYRTTADQWLGLGVSAVALLGFGAALHRRRSVGSGPVS